ncbi:MAG: pyridoxamine 5-phosphate oxidase-related FMN-binding protein [Anaerocolumna sp.]|jgi:general stress protein 26|nr:pyridoxamine 5-phosphate oxidase-related FMN-binding protein [Anaerocolumna sp.]
MNKEIIARAAEIVASKTDGGNEGYCVLALIDNEGYPTTSTISASKAEGINWITFCTGLGSNKTRRIEKCNRASVCFDSIDHNITLVGTIEVITDPEIKKEMWYKGLENHFNGSDDPDYCVLCFKTDRYNLLVDWKEASGNL